MALIGDVISNWTGTIALRTAGAVGLTLTLFILGGFCEEVFYRGLMLRVLEPKGKWIAAVVTALLFGLSHIMNAAAGMSPEVVLWQLAYASAYGLAYAGFVFRTGVIWPIIITHFLDNFLTVLVSGWETQTQQVTSVDRWLNIVYTLGLSAYGIYHVRKHRREVTRGESLTTEK